MYDYLIVGAGFTGSVLAERLATSQNARVLLIDRRCHIGGNAYDYYDDAGILVHKYGPHIFHTNSLAIFTYLSRFTKWVPYSHRVLASVDDMLVPIPINNITLNKLYGLSLSCADVAPFLASVAEHRRSVISAEDMVISRVGQDLYEKLFRGYTIKQWGTDPSQLTPSVTARVLHQGACNDLYFQDRYQVMPANGYHQLFSKMLASPNIEVHLNTTFSHKWAHKVAKRLIFTGPINDYFENCYGSLPYRSLIFEHATLPYRRHQPVGVVNYPNQHAYTRITEFAHLTGQEHQHTSIVYETPSSTGDPYYPIPTEMNYHLYRQYADLAKQIPNISFAGRLGRYRYINMDQAVGQALTMARALSRAT
jgi:UDP-galactopyranose mutase